MDVSALNLGMIAAYYNISCKCSITMNIDERTPLRAAPFDEEGAGPRRAGEVGSYAVRERATWREI